MRRTIKRTEITIETVEITTIRRTRQETGEEETLRSEESHPPLMLSAIVGPVELNRENEIEEKSTNDKKR
jgi:hypothetical protein